jgi:hypothetical protein
VVPVSINAYSRSEFSFNMLASTSGFDYSILLSHMEYPVLCPMTSSLRSAPITINSILGWPDRFVQSDKLLLTFFYRLYPSL